MGHESHCDPMWWSVSHHSHITFCDGVHTKKKKIMETFFAGWNVSQILYSVKHTLDDNEKGFQYGYESSRIVR